MKHIYCTVEDCSGPVLARGLCNKHYIQERNRGNLPLLNKSLKERFEEKFVVDSETGCWVWTASKSPHGWGYFRINGKTRKASRISWELYKKPIPKGLYVLHKCDNPQCVNPDHLFLGDQADNLRDAAKKGNLSNKIDNETANEICRRYASGSFTQRELAKIYGIAQATVWWTLTKRDRNNEELF